MNYNSVTHAETHLWNHSYVHFTTTVLYVGYLAYETREHKTLGVKLCDLASGRGVK